MQVPLPYINITYTLYIIFYFLLSIVSINLMVGLTVDDIKEFLDEAEFKNLKLKLTFVLGIEKLYYSRYLLYTKFFLRFMNTQKFKLTQRRNRVYNNDVVSKQRIWQLILQKGIDDIKKVIYKLYIVELRFKIHAQRDQFDGKTSHKQLQSKMDTLEKKIEGIDVILR